MVRAMQDDLVTPVGQGRPAIGEVPDVIGPGRLKPAGAERALSRREIRTLLPPRGDNHGGARQWVDPQVSVAHRFHLMRNVQFSSTRSMLRSNFRVMTHLAGMAAARRAR